MRRQPDKKARGWMRSPSGLILLAFLAIAAFFLITEHRAHLFGILPLVLLLLCPVLHLFMHGRHRKGFALRRRSRASGHAGHGENQSRPPQGGA